MKRRFSLFLAVMMCCSLVFTALPTAQAVELDLNQNDPVKREATQEDTFPVLEVLAQTAKPEEPELSDKIVWSLRVKMIGTTDDTLLRVRINLVAPTFEEIKAANPAPDNMTLDEYAAYTNSVDQKYSQARAAVYEPFIQNYLNTVEEQVESPENYYILATLSKTKIAALARLDEVQSIERGQQDPLVPVIPPAEPGEQVVPEKIESRLQREMDAAADDGIIRILLWLNVPSNAEIDATVPPPEDPSDPEQREAFISAAYRARHETILGIVESFVQDHMKGTNELLGAGSNGPYLLAATTKSRILSLTALDEVRGIDQYGIPAFAGDSDPPKVPTGGPDPDDPEVLKKLTSSLEEEMGKVTDNSRIPISIWLAEPSREEIEAMISESKPGEEATIAEVNTYISAKRKVEQEVISGITDAFVQDHLAETDVIYFKGKYIANVIVEVPKSKILSLAALEEVTQIGSAFGHDQIAYGQDGESADPEVMKKLTSSLEEEMGKVTDNSRIPISIWLAEPSREEIEAMISEPKPGEGATLAEVNTYISAKRKVEQEAISGITDAFAQDHLAETDVIYFKGKYIANVIVEVPKSKILSLAALEEVTQIGSAFGHDQIAYGQDGESADPEVTKKLSSYLQEYMASVGNEKYVAISIWLAEPTQEEIDAMVPVSVPGASATLQEVNAYIAAKRKVEKDVISGITGASAQNHLDETDVIYFKGKFIPNVVVEVPKSKILSLAELNEVKHINAAFDHDQIAYGQDGEPVDPSVRCEHEYKTAVTAPTCTEAGFTTYTCDRCGDEYSDGWTDALSHDWDEGVVTKQPTETIQGERTFTCARCGETKTEAIPVKEHVHAYTDVVTAPTCTEAGFTTHTCACGDSYVDTAVPALGHDWDESAITKEPTETETGERTFTCTRCSVTKTEAIPVKPHVHAYVDAVTAPTCTEAGFTTYTCACGDSYVDTAVPALGHDWDAGVIKKEATETEQGERTFTCTRCGEKKTEAIPVKEHVHHYIEIKTAPTCTEVGYSVFTCACGRSYKGDEVPALGHDFQDGVCTRCGAKDPDYVPPVVDPFRFDDVKDNALFYYEPVYWAVEQKITKGTSEKLFSPNGSCTRAQVVTFLWRAAGEPEPAETLNPFQDVKADAYYYKAVLWAVEQGVTKGTSADAFSPEATCTRAQIVTFLYRANGSPELTKKENPFKDVAEGEYYADAVAWAVENGITTGKSADTFAPNVTCTRGEIVTFLYRCAGKE